MCISNFQINDWKDLFVGHRLVCILIMEVFLSMWSSFITAMIINSANMPEGQTKHLNTDLLSVLLLFSCEQ